MRDNKRPYVICHMLPSIDGRIVTRGWDVKNATREYERTAATFDADAWIIGGHVVIDLPPPPSERLAQQCVGRRSELRRIAVGRRDRRDYVLDHAARAFSTPAKSSRISTAC